MRPIPAKLRKQLSEDHYYWKCARENAVCNGRITWHHCFKYAGKQINEAWAIQPLCFYHHQGRGFDKNKSEYLALQRASLNDLAKYPKVDWLALIRYLKQKYDNRDSIKS